MAQEKTMPKWANGEQMTAEEIAELHTEGRDELRRELASLVEEYSRVLTEIRVLEEQKTSLLGRLLERLEVTPDELANLYGYR